MHSFLSSLFSSSGSFKVSRSFNRDKFPRRDAFPPSVPKNRKRRQSELQIEKYIIPSSRNFYKNFKFSYLYTFRDEWDRDQWSQFGEQNRTVLRFLSIVSAWVQFILIYSLERFIYYLLSKVQLQAKWTTIISG